MVFFESLRSARRNALLLRLVIGLDALFILVLLNYYCGDARFGGVRLSSIWANWAVFGVACTLPCIALRVRRFARLQVTTKQQAILLPAAWILCCFGLLGVAMELFAIVFLTDLPLMPSTSRLRPQKTIGWNGKLVHVWSDYQDNASLEVILDGNIAGPLIWRRNLASFYVASEVTVTPIDAHHLRCRVVEPDPRGTRDVPLPLRTREVVLTVD